MYLLDTNVISEFRKMKSGRADRNVIAWNADIPLSEQFVSVITMLELEVGVLRAERRDKAAGIVLRDWFEQTVVPEFSARILDVSQPVAKRCAQLHVPDPRPYYDALIAATALVHGLIIVTRNVADFAPTGAKLLNPWEKR